MFNLVVIITDMFNCTLLSRRNNIVLGSITRKLWFMMHYLVISSHVCSFLKLCEILEQKIALNYSWTDDILSSKDFYHSWQKREVVEQNVCVVSTVTQWCIESLGSANPFVLCDYNFRREKLCKPSVSLCSSIISVFLSFPMTPSQIRA